MDGCSAQVRRRPLKLAETSLSSRGVSSSVECVIGVSFTGAGDGCKQVQQASRQAGPYAREARRCARPPPPPPPSPTHPPTHTHTHTPPHPPTPTPHPPSPHTTHPPHHQQEKHSRLQQGTTHPCVPQPEAAVLAAGDEAVARRPGHAQHAPRVAQSRQHACSRGGGRWERTGLCQDSARWQRAFSSKCRCWRGTAQPQAAGVAHTPAGCAITLRVRCTAPRAQPIQPAPPRPAPAHPPRPARHAA